MNRWLARFVLFSLVGLLAAASVRQFPDSARKRMANDAGNLLSLLDHAQRRVAIIAFDDANRLDWHFIPRTGRGITLASLNDEQRRAVHALLRSALSEHGYLNAVSIIELENVLRELESRPDRPATHRDPGLYRLTIFGDPKREEPWGWRFEGHHLALNFSSITDELTSATPFFLGANPAEVRTGPRAGLRVLGGVETLAREFLHSLDESQRAISIIHETAPRDILFGPGRSATPDQIEGVSFESLSSERQRHLWQLAALVIGNVREDISKLDTSSPEALLSGAYFAWAGEIHAGKPHYWRIHGAHWIIEYDNTQNDANHIHLSWRDFHNDFGHDWLKEHYEQHPHPH